MRYYLPKTISYHWKSNSNVFRFDYLAKRRIRRKTYWDLMYAFWFWMFLEFAVKVGFGSILPMQDLGSNFANLYSLDIKLPKADHTRKLPGYRHLIYISLDKDRVIKIDGVKCEWEQLSEPLSIALREDQQIVTSLIIDRNVEMSEVNRLLNLLRKTGLRRINFMCTNSSKMF